jgi:hypothetical protein
VLSFFLGVIAFTVISVASKQVSDEYRIAGYDEFLKTLEEFFSTYLGITHIEGVTGACVLFSFIVCLTLLVNRYIRRSDIRNSAAMRTWLAIKSTSAEGANGLRKIIRYSPVIIGFILILLLYIPVKIYRSLKSFVAKSVASVSIADLVEMAIQNEDVMITAIKTRYSDMQKFAAEHGAGTPRFERDPAEESFAFDYDYLGEVYTIYVSKDLFSDGSLVNAKPAPKSTEEGIARVHDTIRKLIDD